MDLNPMSTITDHVILGMSLCPLTLHFLFYKLGLIIELTSQTNVSSK
jgi:hypothetical protein